MKHMKDNFSIMHDIYDICLNGCIMYFGDDLDECEICRAPRYDEEHNASSEIISKTPIATIKQLSILKQLVLLVYDDVQ